MTLRKRSAFIFLLSCIFACVLPSCGDGITGMSMSDIQTLIPLKVGSSWTYLDITPSSLPSFPDDSTIVHAQVNGYVNTAGIRYYALNGFIGEGDSAMFYESVTQTRYQRYRENEHGAREVIATLLETPIQRGHRWLANGTDNSRGYAEITSTDTTIEIASGRFSNVIYVRQLPPGNCVWCIKPGVGIVYETYFEIVTVTRQLLDKNF